VIYFEASDQVLARRFGETRRPHPMADDASGMAESIQNERAALKQIRSLADRVIDTSAFTVHDLKAYILDNFLDAARGSTLLVQFQSFGYKYGVPQDMDLVFDVRFITNPFFVEELKGLTGRDAPVVEFLQQREEYRVFLDKVLDLLRFLLPLYVKEGKSYLRIGIGCTGGKHRSVAVSEYLAAELAGGDVRLKIRHRDLERE